MGCGGRVRGSGVREGWFWRGTSSLRPTYEGSAVVDWQARRQALRTHLVRRQLVSLTLHTVDPLVGGRRDLPGMLPFGHP